MKHFIKLLLPLAAIMAWTIACDDSEKTTTSDEVTLSIPDPSITAVAEGGTCSVAFKIGNPQSNGVLSAGATVDWISEVVCDEANEVITFEVEANTGSASRTGTIEVEYTYGTKFINKTITVKQSKNASIKFNGSYCYAYYYGLQYTTSDAPEAARYYIVLSDKTATSDPTTNYRLDLYSATQLEDFDSPTVPAGTYTIGDGEWVDASMGTTNSAYLTANSSGSVSTRYFTEGSVVVYNNTDGSTHIYGQLYDDSGYKHVVEYELVIDEWYNYDDYSVGFTQDESYDLSGGICNAYFSGYNTDSDGTVSAAMWQIYITDPDYAYRCVIVLMGETSNTFAAGLPIGYYSAAYTGAAGTFYAGYIYADSEDSDANLSPMYSWFYALEYSETYGTYLASSPCTNLGSDTSVSITYGEEDGAMAITVKTPALDENTYGVYHNVTITWEGVPSYTDLTASSEE